MATNNDNSYADILSQLSDKWEKDIQDIASGKASLSESKEQTLYLREINETLKQLSRGASQSAAKDRIFSKYGRFGTDYDNWASGSFSGRRQQAQKLGSFSDELERQLISGLFGSDFQDRIKKSLEGFAEELGVTIEEIPGKIGQELGKQIMDRLKSTPTGQRVVDYISGYTNRAGSYFRDKAMNIASGKTGKGISEAASNIMGGFAEGGIKGGLGALQSEAVVGAAALGEFALAVGPAAIAMIGLEVITDNLAMAAEDVIALFKTMGKVAKREQESRKKNLELAQQRLTDDVNTLIREPFEILKKAAQEVYNAWDSNIQLINATQGYNKTDLQNLMSAFAQRLRDEGLTNVISTTSVTDSLASVLKAGLSGKVAEEFAYQAAKLSAAVPSQDFFGFASSYASVAANAIKDGKSQSEAIALANKSLYEFTNNVLYASRELAGGFTTGLRDATSLYEMAVKIQQASRTGDVNKIAGVLTSVSAITGAIAPDLASSMTDAIYRAATGGNSADIVALRSLAGINASNTEFLKALAQDPQSVFSNLFTNLANMYNQSADAFMEKAEGYASLFGLSSEAFQRIDFNYLANAISSMNVSSTALADNFKLLAAGQTTTSAEQLKIAQINKYMIEEGLSYVMDSEAARSIQEHMWDEQIARETMEATYGVELQGAALTALQSIGQAVSNILDFLNPFAWIKRVTNLVRSREERKAEEADIKQVLELGKVGQGREIDLYNLTTRNQNLKLVDSLVNLMGGQSKYQTARELGGLVNSMLGSATAEGLIFGIPSTIKSLQQAAAASASQVANTGSPNSAYRWGVVGKSMAKSASMVSSLLRDSVQLASSTNSYAAHTLSTTTSSILDKMLTDEYIQKFIDEGKSYSDWKASGKFKSEEDFAQALSESGYQEIDLQNYFTAKETERGLQEEHIRAERERIFQETGTAFWATEFWEKYNDPLVLLLTEKFDTIIVWQTNFREYFETVFVEEMRTKWEEYLEVQTTRWDILTDRWDVMRDWWESYNKRWDAYDKKISGYWKTYSDYYIKHKIYSDGTLGLKSLQRVQNKEKKEKGDLVNALAEYLTANSWNLDDFKDPQIQANALLSQILIVVNAIMNQNTKNAGAVALGDTLSALAIGSSNSAKTR